MRLWERGPGNQDLGTRLWEQGSGSEGLGARVRERGSENEGLGTRVWERGWPLTCFPLPFSTGIVWSGEGLVNGSQVGCEKQECREFLVTPGHTLRLENTSESSDLIIFTVFPFQEGHPRGHVSPPQAHVDPPRADEGPPTS